ncbi:unnamed protein product, partial [Polarella glacialis]
FRALGGVRLATLMRKPLAGKYEAQCLDTGGIRLDDVEAGMVAEHIEFVKSRRLLMLYVVSGQASIELFPRGLGGLGASAVRLSPDGLLILDHQALSYKCRLSGEEPLVLQSWIAAMPEPNGLAVQEVRGPLHEDLVLSAPTPAGPGYLTMVTGLACRMACSEGTDQAWNSFLGNVDGYTVIPKLRFDVDVYYDEQGRHGSTRTKHSALFDDKYFLTFDHEFFGWTEEFTSGTSVLNRLAIDIGYDCIHRAGLRKKDILGQRIGFHIGHTGDFEGNIGRSPPTMLSYFLGTTGPATVVDTACSSALVSMNLGHQDCCLGRAHGVLVGGVNALTDVMPYIAMSSGRMISSRGRSRAFDHSADGYGRGEGFAAIFMEPSGENPIRAKEQALEWCRVAGSNIGQDGRSASITAPSGPAQTACIHACIREAGISPAEVSFGECHGTGTALGDPIEVGSSRIVMESARRSSQYIFGAAKSNVGHLELGAGTVGVLKVVLMLNHNACVANCHFYQLNEHFSVQGFPVMMPTELLPLAKERQTFAGVCSFGFGGTNARVELWARRRRFDPGSAPQVSPVGPQRRQESRPLQMEPILYSAQACPCCSGAMCWLCGVAIPDGSVSVPRQHRCCTVREESDNYKVCSNCYEGPYAYGIPEYQDVVNPHRTLYLIGSWTAWSGLEELELGLDGSYEFSIRLGESLCERFSLIVDMDRQLSVHPIHSDANEHARIEGPDRAGSEKYWLIDGRQDGATVGTHYRVSFTWGASWKSISWKLQAKETLLDA